jgi:D-glycero-alpha-D-manno-heptose-7-phosphate kinase
MIIRSKAPLRMSFGGGGTDVSPYSEERGGVTLSATIDKYAYCTLNDIDKDVVTVHSLDYDIKTLFKNDDDYAFNGKLDLIKAALRVFNIKEGLSLLIHSDIPPGSGLGASSTMTVALVGALKEYLKLPLEIYDIAELAYKIERKELGISGGKQDQYAATFGNFNFTEFFGDRVVVNPLRIREDTRNELEYRLILCYTGKTRLSAGIINDQISRYVQRKEDTVRALDVTKQLAVEMKNALLLNRIDEFGLLMNEAWQAKKKFSSLITDSHIDSLFDIALKSGALGGKLLGAGGGGYLLILCEIDKKHLVAQALESSGGQIVPFAFETRGLQTWVTGDGAVDTGGKLETKITILHQ